MPAKPMRLKFQRALEHLRLLLLKVVFCHQRLQITTCQHLRCVQWTPWCVCCCCCNNVLMSCCKRQRNSSEHETELTFICLHKEHHHLSSTCKREYCDHQQKIARKLWPEFLSVRLIWGIDLNHFIPLSLILTLGGGYKISKSRTCWLHFLTLCSTDEEEFFRCKAVQIVQPLLLLGDMFRSEGNHSWFSDCAKQLVFNVGMHLNVYESVCFKLGLMIANAELKFKVQGCWKAKLVHQLSCKVYDGCGLNLACCWDLLV